ncbi:hypothetical protein [Levilactobacillus huananensis]|uniref:hypothetical protein n=1 Tax=Levilactobacillus huananensis TaxID=2486019 RepID=UPI000F767F0A|nr:hypothetical protein [Levilactobacillus huananensis]
MILSYAKLSQNLYDADLNVLCRTYAHDDSHRVTTSNATSLFSITPDESPHHAARYQLIGENNANYTSYLKLRDLEQVLSTPTDGSPNLQYIPPQSPILTIWASP